MIDDFISQKTLGLLGPSSDRIRQSGLNGNVLIGLSLAAGLIAGGLVALQFYLPALVLFCLNRLLDSLARLMDETNTLQSKRIVYDRIMFASFIFLFSLGAANTSLAAAFLLLSFLVVSVFNQKKCGLRPIVEKSEIALFCIACCVVPLAYAPLCIIVGFLCWVDGARMAINAEPTS